jgi:hypothetical protein
MKRKIMFGLMVMLISLGFSALIAEQDQQEMMKKWQAFMTPGEFHQQLAYYVGDWTYTGKSWMAPGTPATPTSGSARGKMILGGRYLMQEYEGESMGMTFQGIGTTAFDNFLKEFHSVWVDSLGTGIFLSKGKPGDGKTREETGTMADIVTGENVTMRNVFTILGPDSYKMEMYNSSKSIPEYKSMEMVFTRKK